LALELNDEETDRLAHAVAELTGETLADAVRKALSERLERERAKHERANRLLERVMEIGRHCATLPDVDLRSSDQILGYGEDGLPQ
jgi:antitoxin VapB